MVAILEETEAEGVWCLPTLRKKFKHRKLTSKNVADDLVAAIEGLLELGLIVKTQAPPEFNQKKDPTRNSKMKGWFKKKPLADQAPEGRNLLQISARHFPP